MTADAQPPFINQVARPNKRRTYRDNTVVLRGRRYDRRRAGGQLQSLMSDHAVGRERDDYAAVGGVSADDPHYQIKYAVNATHLGRLGDSMHLYYIGDRLSTPPTASRRHHRPRSGPGSTD